jgi:UDPglucose--hexose-1-phosphate uridylyltransferase
VDPTKPLKPIWEQRWHPLREEWVLFTAHRGGRPWIGDTHKPASNTLPSYDPTCALCPGNKRLHGVNPNYTGAYCFTNDLPCFSPESQPKPSDDEFYQKRPASGTAEVVCYSPDHSKTFVDLNDSESRAVVDLWTERPDTRMKFTFFRLNHAIHLLRSLTTSGRIWGS